jgi:RND family efflux transporter MFP subunit
MIRRAPEADRRRRRSIVRVSQRNARGVETGTAAALVVALGMSAGCQASSATRQGTVEGANADAREVRLVPAAEEQLVRAITVTGTLAAEEQVTLSMKVTGRLQNLYVDLGSPARRGQVLARLVPTDFSLREDQAEAALQQARARLGLPADGDDSRIDIEKTALVRSARALLEEARLNRARTKEFFDRGIAAKAALDSADAALQVADSRYQDALEEVRNRQAVLAQRRTELELTRQALRDSSLTSPLDGMVRERHVTEGQYLAAGSPVVTLVRVHPLRLRVAVPERESQLVRVNQEVRVTVEGDPTSYPGRVARVSPAIDENSRSLMVEAEIPNANGQLRPGAFANASIVSTDTDRAVLVPASALVTFAGVEKVLGVKDGKVVEKRVTVGRREAGRLEIVAGLAAGESVIAEPGNLVEGTPVRVSGAGNTRGRAE